MVIYNLILDRHYTKEKEVNVPHITRKTAVAFVHQHQIVLLEAIDRNRFDLAFFLQLIHIDHDHVIASGCESAILFEHGCKDGRQGKFFKVLLAHAFIGRKHNNLVNAEFTVQALGTLEIMKELQDVHVHDQSLTAASSTHESQLILFICGVWLRIGETERFGFLVSQPCIQICAKCFCIGKVAIQIHLSKKQCDVLKVSPDLLLCC